MAPNTPTPQGNWTIPENEPLKTVYVITASDNCAPLPVLPEKPKEWWRGGNPKKRNA